MLIGVRTTGAATEKASPMGRQSASTMEVVRKGNGLDVSVE